MKCNYSFACDIHALFCIVTFPTGSQILTDYEIIGVGVGGCALLIIILSIIIVIIIKKSKYTLSGILSVGWFS